MSNISLVEWFCAEDVTGLKHVTEAWDILMYMVGERSVVGRSHSVSDGGRSRSENAGISSENYVRIIMAESLRFPGEGSSAPG